MDVIETTEAVEATKVLEVTEHIWVMEATLLNEN